MKEKIDRLIEVAKQIGYYSSDKECPELLGELGRLRDELILATSPRREVTPKYAMEVVKRFADHCNISQWDKKDVREAVVSQFTCTHRYLQNEMMTVLRVLIDMVGQLDPDTHCDARNVWAYSWAQKVRQIGW